MAKHRIRRWLQFGVLDLLILTTIVTVGVVLWQSPRIATHYEPLVQGAAPGQHWDGNGLRMKFRWCPAGDFKMGTKEKPNYFEDQVDVKLTRGFWLAKYEVTQGEYRQVMNDNPSHFCPDNLGRFFPAGVDAEKLPVEGVSWQQAVEFCGALTALEREAGRLPVAWEYRLPTEAQWEYACRAGTQTAYSFGDDESRVGEFAWFRDNSKGRTHEVGQKLPNPWGLHDMHGNVVEWCSDWFHKLPGGTDPEVEVTGRPTHRVARGAGWISTGRRCRSYDRDWTTPGGRNYDLGFRVALVQPAKPSKESNSADLKSPVIDRVGKSP